MPKKYTYIMPVKDAGARLDIFLSKKMGVSRSQVQAYIMAGDVLVNGKLPKKAGDILKDGCVVTVEEKKKEKKIEVKVEVKSAEPMRIISEEKEYVVVHKPAGLLVHPTQAKEKDTLFSRLTALYPEIAGIGDNDARGGIVHRLDKEASGLLVVARTEKMFGHLKKQFQERTIEKEYLVLVHGRVLADTGEIVFSIDRGADGRMVARPQADALTVRGVRHQQEGKSAHTEFTVVQRFARYTLLLVKIHTGRMHQIRVHMQAYGYPVVGDTLYFNKKLNRTLDAKLGRLFLHAGRLCFDDLDGKRVCFEDVLPRELRFCLENII